MNWYWTFVGLGWFEDGWSPWQTGRHKISPEEKNGIKMYSKHANGSTSDSPQKIEWTVW